MEVQPDLAVPAPAAASTPPFARNAAEVAASLGTDTASGLSAAEAARRAQAIRRRRERGTAEAPDSALREAHVLIDREERKAIILDGARVLHREESRRIPGHAGYSAQQRHMAEDAVCGDPADSGRSRPAGPDSMQLRQWMRSC